MIKGSANLTLVLACLVTAGFISGFFIKSSFLNIDDLRNKPEPEEIKNTVVAPKPIKLSFSNSSIYADSYNSFSKLAAPSFIRDQRRKIWGSTKCLNLEEADRDFSVLSKEHPNLIKNLEVIQSKEFKSIGSETKSKKAILYESVCAKDGSYYIIFTTKDISPSKKDDLNKNTTTASQLYYGPQHVALINKSGELEIAEEITKLIRPIKLAQQGILVNRIPHSGCTKILGVLDNIVYISCNGENGTAHGNSLVKINGTTQVMEELSYCQTVTSKETCWDKDGSIYYQSE